MAPVRVHGEGATLTETASPTPEEPVPGARLLPDPEQVSLISANIAVPLNPDRVANVLSDGSIAYDASSPG